MADKEVAKSKAARRQITSFKRQRLWKWPWASLKALSLVFTATPPLSPAPAEDGELWKSEFALVFASDVEGCFILSAGTTLRVPKFPEVQFYR